MLETLIVKSWRTTHIYSGCEGACPYHAKWVWYSLMMVHCKVRKSISATTWSTGTAISIGQSDPKWSFITPLQSTREYRTDLHKHRVARCCCASRITVHSKCLRRLPLAWQRLSQASHVACTKCRTPLSHRGRTPFTKSGDFTLTSSPPYPFWIDVGQTHGPRRSLHEPGEWTRG